MKRKIILASGSPRRKELLENLGIDFEVMVDTSDEVVKIGLNPSEVVCDLAMQKAKNIEKRLNDDEIIIAADTIVVLDDELLGKPKDRENAVEILTKLSGNTHCVFTGIAVIDTKTNQIINDFEKTFVKFRDISI
ncbi:MAG: Maf family protein, partial [Oscillospiraceae bacterium]